MLKVKHLRAGGSKILTLLSLGAWVLTSHAIVPFELASMILSNYPSMFAPPLWGGYSAWGYAFSLLFFSPSACVLSLLTSRENQSYHLWLALVVRYIHWRSGFHGLKEKKKSKVLIRWLILYVFLRANCKQKWLGVINSTLPAITFDLLVPSLFAHSLV